MGTVIVPTFEILTVELSVEILSINKKIPGGTCSLFNISQYKKALHVPIKPENLKFSEDISLELQFAGCLSKLSCRIYTISMRH